MTEDTLEEYVRICKTIDNIHNKINKYKINILDSLKHTSSEKEHNDKIKEFHKIIKKISSDPVITHRYRELKKSKDELKKKIINTSDFDNTSSLNKDINKELTDLKDKYNILSKKNIIIIEDEINYNVTIDNKKFNSILDEIQLNLIKNDISKS